MLTQPQNNEPREKSVARRIAEKQAKKQGKKFAKKLVKQGGKLAVKLAKMAAKKLALLIAKGAAWLLGTIGLPVILIAIFTIMAIFIFSLAFSYFFGTGEGLDSTDKKTYEYIVQQANSTVDMNSALEKPYRVPEKLIAATIQLEFFEGRDDIKAIIRNMANKLAPTFDYGQYEEWTEKQVTVCRDGDCKEGAAVKDKKMVSKLNFVEYWNGTTKFTYTPVISEWKTKTEITYETVKEFNEKEVSKTIMVPVTREKCETETIMYPYPHQKTSCTEVTEMEMQTTSEKQVETIEKVIEVKTITKTRNKYHTSTKNITTDYATFDSILNSYGLGINDKKLLEVNYLFLDGNIAYTEWLQTMGGEDLGLISYDGTIIPGGGVPPQYMPYYLSAEKKYGVHWYVLAAIHFVETGFSTHKTMISSVGALGHMQFMPATWVGWDYNIGGGLVSSSLDITSLSVIAKGRGHGRDGNGDGKADPWDLEDAIHTAAYSLSVNKYASDPRNAIYKYNHAEWYINKVLKNAENFKNAATYEVGGDTPAHNPGGFMRPTSGPLTSGVGPRWGTYHYGVDLGSGGKKNVPIVASAEGVVSRSYYSKSYGNVVFIKHKIDGKVYETVYAHMQNRAVAQGATVKQGQFLGYMGATGDSQGVHLHFEIHLNAWNSSKSNVLNPAKIIKL